MRKIYFSMLLAGVFLGGIANAQHSSQKVTIGIKGGLNLYNLHVPNNNSSNLDSKIGFNAGLLGHVHLIPHFALQPEIVYSLQGVKAGGTGDHYKVDLGYINVPILLQYMFDNGFRIQAGPQAGFLVSAKQKFSNRAATDIKSDFKTVELGIAAGISYVHPATGFGVDLRYNHGITSINNVTAVKETNRGGQLGIFYLFSHRHIRHRR